MTYEEIIGRWAAMIPADVKPQIDAIAARCRDLGIKVASYSLVYNHEPFLRECLDGIVMQQTSFPYVAIVHDDASTDGSRAIIEEYARRYPDLIFPIYESENQYRRPGGPLTYIIHAALAATGCEYVAICEGDDYWTSTAKLQIQADFLDAHPAYSIVAHKCKWKHMRTNAFSEQLLTHATEYDRKWLFDNGYWPVQTPTVMYRIKNMNFNKYLQYHSRYDLILFWHLLEKGKGYSFKDDMAVYRVHTGGVWSSLNGIGKWDFDYRIRNDLYDVEHSDETLDYWWKSLILHNLGRNFVLKHRMRQLHKLYICTIKHKGFSYANSRLLLYLLANRV